MCALGATLKKIIKKKTFPLTLTFHDLDNRPVLEALDGLELGKVVHGDAFHLQGEAGAVTAVLSVHQ
jgi:hypothetical protein